MPHPLTNFEIQNYYENESKFKSIYARNNSSEIKDGAYLVNLDEYESIEIIGLLCIQMLKMYYFLIVFVLFFFYLGFLSRTFTNRRTAVKGAWHFLNSSLPLTSSSQTLRHQPGDYCREINSGHSQQPESNREPLVSERKSLSYATQK